MSEPIPVRVRDCACPGHPHNGVGDVVYMRPTPSMQLGLAVEADIIASASNATLLSRAWALSYVRYGVVGWNFLDAKGKERVLDVSEILDDWEIGMVVAEKADELYGDRVVNPLLTRLFGQSEPGATDDSTSPTEESTPPPRKRSSRVRSAATGTAG